MPMFMCRRMNGQNFIPRQLSVSMLGIVKPRRLLDYGIQPLEKWGSVEMSFLTKKGSVLFQENLVSVILHWCTQKHWFQRIRYWVHQRIRLRHCRLKINCLWIQINHLKPKKHRLLPSIQLQRIQEKRSELPLSLPEKKIRLEQGSETNPAGE